MCLWIEKMNLKYSSEPIGKEYSIEISFMNQITQERLLYQVT